MSEELRPCMWCGGQLKRGAIGSKKFIECQNMQCAMTLAYPTEQCDEDNAFCWKEIDRLKSELAAALKRAEEAEKWRDAYREVAFDVLGTPTYKEIDAEAQKIMEKKL